MCFSATASFTAGAALTVVGGLTVRKSQGGRELPLAMIPLLFGVQQLTEGVVWVTLGRDLPTVESWATFIYSTFSHVVWPILVPFAILLVEPRIWRRKAISAIGALGLAVGLYLLYFMVRFPITARVNGDSIAYESPHFYIAFVLVAYLTATCISGLFSSHWCIRGFGASAFILAIAASVISITTFVSVWCFYAAILSFLIYLHFSGPMQACRHLLPAAHPRPRSAAQ
jgi:hypothetical protein